MARNRRRNRRRNLLQFAPDLLGPGELESGLPPMDGDGEDAPEAEPEDTKDLYERGQLCWQRFEEYHKRAQSDADYTIGQWYEDEQSPTKKPNDTIIGDTRLMITVFKYTAILTRAKRVRSIKPTRPDQSRLIQAAEDAWRHVVAQVQAHYARSMRSSFARQEAYLACLRGVVARRLRLNPEKMLADDPCPIEQELVDPITLAPQWTDGGLEFMVQKRSAVKSTVLATWPELANAGIDQIDNAREQEQLDITTIYTKTHVHRYLGATPLGEPLAHNYGFVPFVWVACRSLIDPVLMTDGTITYSTVPATADWRNPQRLGNGTRYLGISCIHEMIPPLRSLLEDELIVKTSAKQQVDPTFVVEAENPEEIETEAMPGGRIEIGPGEKATPLSLPNKLDALQFSSQQREANIRMGTLPPSAYGDGESASSGLASNHERYAWLDSIMPYAEGLALADQVAWYQTCCLYAQHADRGLNVRRQQGVEYFWDTLAPEDFETIKDAECAVEFRNLLPNDLMTYISLAVQAKREGILPLKMVLGKDFLNIDDPDDAIQQLLVEQAMDQLPGARALETLVALQTHRPELMGIYGPLLQAQIQQALMQAQMVVPPGGQPGGPQPQLPPSPSAPGAAGIPPGQPPPGATPGPPLPFNQPGQQAQFAGMGGVPSMEGQGLPPTALGGSPYGMGQVGGQEGMIPQDLQHMLMMQRLMAGGTGG